MKKVVCILALAGICVVSAAPQADIDAAIARGVKFLLAQQAADGSFSDPQMPALTALPLWALVRGGFGYDRASRRRYADLSNTSYALDAMRRTEGVEEFRPQGEAKADLNWEQALKFVERLQEKEGRAPAAPRTTTVPRRAD